MRFEVFNPGGRIKVAFFCKTTFSTILSNDSNVLAIAKHNNLEIHLLDVDFLDSGESIRGSCQEHRRLESDQRMKELYTFVLDNIKERGIKICVFFGSGYPWPASFLEKVRKYAYAACYFADDPEGSDETSHYYVKNYHYAFCAGIFFDEHKRIEEKYLDWGARKSKFIPLGACPEKYRLPFNPLEKRTIDIVYVGGGYLKKIIPLFRLKKHFGSRMKLFGRSWNYDGTNIIKKTLARIVKAYYRIPRIEELPTGDLVNLYQKTKIGFNTHMSYGPSNQRMYELPMNGVMQICDCENGLSELYEIDKEVVSYKTIDEAIEKIEFYLKHDEKRIEIALAGHTRAKNDYLVEHSFRAIKTEILDDIRDNYSQEYGSNER
jgi:spore maturation protein CgeB